MDLSDVGRQSDDYRTINWTMRWIRVNTLRTPERYQLWQHRDTPSPHAPRSATTLLPCGLPQ